MKSDFVVSSITQRHIGRGTLAKSAEGVKLAPHFWSYPSCCSETENSFE